MKTYHIKTHSAVFRVAFFNAQEKTIRIALVGAEIHKCGMYTQWGNDCHWGMTRNQIGKMVLKDTFLNGRNHPSDFLLRVFKGRSNQLMLSEKGNNHSFLFN